MKKWLAFLLGVSVLVPHAASAAGALNTISAKINGNSSVNVAPGSSLEAMVTTELTGGADWNGTEWALGTSIATPLTCADTENFNTNGIHATTFTIIATTTPGTYNVYFRANSKGACNGVYQGNVFVLPNSVVVAAPAPSPALVAEIAKDELQKASLGSGGRLRRMQTASQGGEVLGVFASSPILAISETDRQKLLQTLEELRLALVKFLQTYYNPKTSLV